MAPTLTPAVLERDFERFKRQLPRDFADHARETYRVDLSASYLGCALPHPVGKASGQLSLNAGQLEADASAGLAFSVLKTVIAEDETGAQTMAAWAIRESRMKVERRTAASGRAGWTVTWKGRGWDRTLEDYVALVATGRDLTRAGTLLVVPSVKYHLPARDQPFHRGEYRHTTTALARAWQDPPLLLEKDFSPTLAADSLAGERAAVLRWLHEVPREVRAASPVPVRIAVKLMNARFDDAFQVEMMNTAAAGGADTLVCFNRLFDASKGVAYGGWDLSGRNLRVLDAWARTAVPPCGLSGTGNIGSGKMILEYARRGCSSVALHTFFQLPLSVYPATHGTRTQRALHALVFDPQDGLVAGMVALEADGTLARHDGELRFLDLSRAS